MRQIDPDVVPVYPITPQTPIIQGFAKFVADGKAHGELVNVESEHSAMSAAIGSALAGARTMTATSSQGLALMAEVVYIAASMRAPIVMAVGNRALSGPINIHCDHSDSMLIRDSGRRPALRRERAGGLRPDGARASRSPSTPTCCCRCSSARTASRSRTRPSRSSCSPTRTCRRLRRRLRDPPSAARHRARRRRKGRSRCRTTTSSFGASRSPRSRPRSRRCRHSRCEFEPLSGRGTGRSSRYRLDDAERVLVALGSSAGTIKDVVDELRDEGDPVGPAEDRLVPAVPAQALVPRSCTTSSSVIVLDRAASPGGAAPLLAEVAAALTGKGSSLRPRLRPRRPRPPSRRTSATSSTGAPRAYVGLRGEPCPA